jgi:hypothetical protein
MGFSSQPRLDPGLYLPPPFIHCSFTTFGLRKRKNYFSSSLFTPILKKLHSGTLAERYFNPLKPKLVQIVFKNSVRTAKKTQHFTITKISWLTLFKEIAVYSEKHKMPINTLRGQNTVFLML